MNATKSKLIFHLIAIVTVIIWGTTFVSTKILIQNGLTPSEIFFYRFVLAYICMWSISRKKFFTNSIKDEFLYNYCAADSSCLV
jgi:drug/metabolite transporter (DMT)-like permease